MLKILDPVGRRRRLAVFGAIFSAATLLTLLIVPSALAVHDIGVFELDTGTHTLGGNPYDGANATDEAVAGDDWNNVCFTRTGDPLCGTSTGDNASASAWSSDQTIQSTSGVFTINPNATIFTGGGSKDPQDTNAWAWKDGAGGLPDKDNLQHAFAARYTVTDSTATPCPGTETTCDVIYYGSDRFDNSGDAQQGFWFLQNATGTSYDTNNDGVPDTKCPQKIGGGTGFCNPADGSAVQHQNNDVLIISDFSNGGTTSSITIYTWQNGALQFEAGGPGTSAQCGSSPGDTRCGIVNLSDGTPAPWPFLDKSGNSSYLKGELFEAGFDLTALGLGGTCFSTVVSETRSSTSTTATLKDFVVAPFGSCSSEMTTAQNWLPNDSASLDVTAPAAWSGEVRFTLYQGTPDSTCSGGTQVYPTVASGKTYEAQTVGSASGGAVTVTASTTNGSSNATNGTFKVTDTSTTGTGSDYFWKVHFEPPTSPAGIPAADKCETTTGITITN
jgi:hypothetical protein